MNPDLIRDIESHKAEMLTHLVRRALIPGAKDHAWFRAKEMAKNAPEMYGDFPEKLIAEVKRRATEVAQ